MTFLRSLLVFAKAHKVGFAVFVLLVPLLLGGLVWKLIHALSKVPGGAAVGKAAEKVAKATGSAAVLFLPGALLAGHYLALGAHSAPLF